MNIPDNNGERASTVSGRQRLVVLKTLSANNTVPLPVFFTEKMAFPMIVTARTSTCESQGLVCQH